MRNLQNINKNTEGVVQEFIGTAYDDVKLVADNLDTIQLVVDAIDNLNPAAFATAAQGVTADSALQPEDINTLGKLNAIVAEDVVGTNDNRLTNARVPTAHTHVTADISDLTLGNYLLETEIDTLAKVNAIITDATLIDTTDARLSNARTPTAHGHPFADLTAVPTTLSGHSITNAYTKAEIDAHAHAFASLTAKPTTLAGYGIVDAAPSSHVGGDIHIDWKVTGAEDIHPDRYTNTDTVYTHPATHPFSMLTGLPSTLSGYGIADNISALTNNVGYMVPADINTLAELNILLTDANLGDVSSFATAAQGVKADTAIQPGVLLHDTFADFVADEHLPSSTFATAAQGALADTALQAFNVNHDDLVGFVADEHLPSATFATAAQGVKADTALQVIASDSITMDMLVDIATNTYLGRVTAATGTVEVLTNAQLKTALNLTGTNSGDQTTVVGISSTKVQFDTALSDGNFAYTGGAFHDLFSDFVADEHMPSSTFATAAQGIKADTALQIIAPDYVTMDMLVDVPTGTLLGRNSALTGTVEILPAATVKTLLNLTGTNTGDQSSVVGITGTKAQFNTAVTDGDFVYVNDLLHDTFSDFVADEHLPSSTFATALQGTKADTALQTIPADYVTMDMLVDIPTNTFLGRTTALTGTVEVLTNAALKTALNLTGTNSGDQTSVVGITGTKAQFNTAVSDGDLVFVGDLLHDTFADFVADEHLPSSTFATAAQGVKADTALQVIAADYVTMDMLVDVPTASFLGRTAALTGTVEVLSVAATKTALNLTGTNSGDQTSIVGITGTKAQFDTALSDDNFVYVSTLLHDTLSDFVPDEHLPSSTFATAAQGVKADTALQTIAPDYVTMDMLVDIPTNTFLGRTTALTGTVEVLTNAALKTALNLTGTNSGDQTSIVGITGTKAQFDTAVSDGNIVYVGDLLHDTFADFVADEHLPSSTFATAAQGVKADTAVQPGSIGTAAAQNVGYFATAAQGALANTALQNAATFATAAQGVKADTAIQPAALTAAIAGHMNHKGDYDATSNIPDLDVTPVPVKLGDLYKVSAGGSFYGSITLEAGDVLIANEDDPASALGWVVINKNINPADFATAAQGTKADTALQASNIDSLGELNAIVGVTLVTSTDPGLLPFEGTALKSTGVTAGHIATAVGDNTTIWAAPSTAEGTAIKSTGIPNGRVLTANGSNASTWVAPTTYSSLLAVKGDIETFDTVRAKLGVGANGTVLTADSALPKGIGWAVLPTLPVAGATELHTTINRNLADKEDIYSNSGLTHTLPITPVVGTVCIVRDYSKDASQNAITVNRNSSLINGVAANFVLDVDGQITWFLCNSSGNWITSTVSDPNADYGERIKIVSAASYTILEADNGYRIIFNFATAIAVTLPDGLSLGHNFTATQVNTGSPTITPNTDTVNGASVGVFPDARWGSVRFVQYDFTEWLAEYTKSGSYLSLP